MKKSIILIQAFILCTFLSFFESGFVLGNEMFLSYNIRTPLFNHDPDTSFARSYYEKAELLSERSEFDSAHTFFHKALSVYQEFSNWEEIVNCYNGIGYNFRDRGSYSPALKNLNLALKIGKEKLPKEHHSVALTYYHIGLVYRRKHEFDKSLKYYQKALDIDLKALGPNHHHVARIYQRKGMSKSRMFEYDKALSLFQKTYDILNKLYGENHTSIAAIYNAFGIVYRNKKEYDQALKYAQKSLDIRVNLLGPLHRNVAFSHTLIGVIYADIGNYDLGLECFEKALEIELNAYGEMHSYVASDYLRIGVSHIDKHNYDLALEYYKKSLDIKLKIFGETSIHIAKIYDRIGNAFKAKKDFIKSQEYFQKSLVIKLDLYGQWHPSVADSYFLMGVNYKKMLDMKNALKYLNIGKNIRLKVKGVTHYTIATFYEEIGSVYQLKRDYNKALDNYSKALKTYQSEFGAEHVYIANIYRYKGKVFFERKLYDTALEYYQKAINVLVNNFDESDINKNPTLDSVFHKHELLYILNDKAIALKEKYALDNNLDHLRLSVSTFMLNIKLIDKIIEGYGSDKTKLAFAAGIHKTYEEALRVSWLLYQKTNEKRLIHSLFQIAEKSKAGLLRASITEMQAKQKAGIPDSLLKLENNLKVDLAYYGAKIQQLKNKKDEKKLNEIENKFFALNRQYKILKERFEEDFPQYFRLKYDSRVTTANEIKQFLPDEKSLFLEYFLGEKYIYFFKISKENISVNSIPKPKKFEKWTNDLQKGIEDFVFLEDSVVESYNLYTNAAFNLYDLILKNELSDSKAFNKIIVVPDGPLAYIPFEALIKEKQKRILDVNQIDYKSLPYLLNSYKINYSYSGTLYLDNNTKPEKKVEKQCLAFAPVYSKDNATLTLRGTLVSLRGLPMNALPGARKEVKAISEFVKGEFRFGNEANESLFKQEAAQFQILHLATHGISDSKNPENAKLIFSSESDSIEDNSLYAYELYNMNLNAELVVLSACQTGKGKYTQGEGVMSLARAFMYAGSQSVVQTLWSTEDESSAIMMTNFYGALSDGKDKATALQQAKLKYLESEDEFSAHPFYWAGFTIYGNVDPIRLENDSKHFYWLILLPFALLFISYCFRIMQKRKTI